MSRNLGGRPRKLDIELTTESLSGVLKNIWNEVEETKRIALQTFNKQQREVKEITDINLIGKINNDYLKTVVAASGQKLEVAKIINSYVQKDAKGDEGSGDKSGSVVSSDDKAAITAMIAAARKSALEEDEEEDEYVPSPEEIQKNEDIEMDKIMNNNPDVDITNADDVGF